MSEGREVMPFTITPTEVWSAAPLEEQNFSLRFSPLEMISAECTFRCKYVINILILVDCRA